MSITSKIRIQMPLPDKQAVRLLCLLAQHTKLIRRSHHKADNACSICSTLTETAVRVVHVEQAPP